MASSDKNGIALGTLALINLLCALFHAVFQIDLLAAEGIYREFLLTENLVVTFIFAYFGLVLRYGRPEEKIVLAKMNILFWAALVVFVLLVRPPVTTLSLVAAVLFLPQYFYLLFLGSVALVLSVLVYRRGRGKTGLRPDLRRRASWASAAG